MTKKVTIELTDEQRAKIREATGEELQSLTYERLEDRDAPKILSGSSPPGGKPDMAPGLEKKL